MREPIEAVLIINLIHERFVKRINRIQALTVSKWKWLVIQIEQRLIGEASIRVHFDKDDGISHRMENPGRLLAFFLKFIMLVNQRARHLRERFRQLTDLVLERINRDERRVRVDCEPLTVRDECLKLFRQTNDIRLQTDEQNEQGTE